MANSRKLPCLDLLQARWSACAKDHILPQQSLVVGLSGGLDSVALLHWLSRHVAGKQNRISAVHVHHGLSSNADDWASHCQALCAVLEVPLVIAKVSVEQGSKDGLEGAARRARHAAFAQAKGDWIVLAHHQRDQAETVLFNLLRGSGVRGAAAMRQRNGRLVRPWLNVGRDEIERYAQREGLRWIEDESNADVRFSRNYLRHRILTSLRARFPTVDERLAAASSRFTEAQALLDDLARIDLAGFAPTFPMPVSLLANLTEARAANLLAYLLRESGIAVTNKARLFEAVRQFSTARPGRNPAVRFGEYYLSSRQGMIELGFPPRQAPTTSYNNEGGQ